MSDSAAAAAAHEVPAAPHGQSTGIENTKLGVWVWLASECAFFASLIGTYLSLHSHYAPGPSAAQLFDLKLTGVATFVLLSSSLTMGLAVEAQQRGQTGRLRGLLAVTALLGLVFVGMQAIEFTTYVHKGLTPTVSAFGSSFFTLVGFHGMHVSFGVAWIVSLLIYTFRKRDFGPADTWRIEIASLYWYFVDVVWVVLFTVVYLMGKMG